ncbi:hypothetical protein A2334_03385 [Candidatus Roizmanbacteria bacterium RIFOXYB2_FULL_38_10]|uniref:Peptidase S9 prolyl oligopeptidase catalytic domain-containing protein n=1 Tax=Candidatus Roizmanbacteria bacterium RIFOXYD1_FULL_38_12 TaxID=1802093 RepID=A0A1F7L112_9BACT|nr:MAG: hypothetical protein A3K47_03460 [Candidatus Roizmanbacteria bacterium RIFOXYA2_FULL_38_14]OGK63820.1 MAG: hypothetical protein A3K27_03460 [Candidatus Roizmanbacteria bacterium RIFOXYA1_FULL_37_12]OGK65666.1 MAG: hypothetical protein A3K38_03460 [Candidatus Roizmanbacteria bacterium RIFOXYB1_FULL_40_23]OGK67446.1 MAG: hypothetical protein A2334_03385 [Candidatus Roizmanbacteria bacterium RIFOXYB2_FULL_38_10]OGK70071.1 MAG: hypothetical protein A3K21_03465 [Candidatus Roizmanbacteria ba
MKKISVFVVCIFIAIASFYLLYTRKPQKQEVKEIQEKKLPLLTYTFKNLKKTHFPSTKITIEMKMGEKTNSFSQMFYFSTPSSPDKKDMLRVSGLMNLPKKKGNYPIIVMLRGFVPDDIYAPGIGTQHVAESLAEHGFITLAPDFLGFGESAPPSSDPFEARFQTYTTALTLLSSLSTLNEALDASYSGTIQANTNNIGIWGHSNGGHIALSLLAISGRSYPTVLWAPVSKTFPYSILFYTDESDDHGKALRKALSNFEVDYDTEAFSPSMYYGWIKAPLSIHQGDVDDAVPKEWSDELVSNLEKNKIDVIYHTYHADHNMLPSSWSQAVGKSISFYDANFKN